MSGSRARRFRYRALASACAAMRKYVQRIAAIASFFRKCFLISKAQHPCANEYTFSMARTSTAKTLAADLTQRIRADILGGRLALGSRLKLAALASDYGVSLTIVREALTNLANARLVKSQPQQGFAVTALTAAELEDLTFVRTSIEGVALERAIARGGLDWEANLLAAHHRLAHTPVLAAGATDRLNEAYVDAHAAFHAALLSACDSPMLMEMRRSLHDASELYRRLAYLLQAGAKDTAAEHRLLMEAALARDVVRARELLTRHYGDTTRICLQANLVAPDDTRAAA
ncbi:MAG: GntR family transcriptional regulator [Burkholderiaceae bacterium]